MISPECMVVIPARGGSKRIPQKNIRLFFGQPLIGWSIAAARESGLFDTVYVSTDDETVAKTARDLDAEVPFLRPSELSEDFTGTDAVLTHWLKWLEAAGCLPKYLCCVYPTAPFLTGAVIQGSYEVMCQQKAHSVLIAISSAMTPWRALKCEADGRVAYQWPEHYSTRSQDFPKTCQDANQCYWLDVESYRNDPRLINENTFPFFIPRWDAQDINTDEDWEMAERLFELNQKKEQAHGQ
jgi:pseudaminic acid cytidylyltransferase